MITTNTNAMQQANYLIREGKNSFRIRLRECLQDDLTYNRIKRLLLDTITTPNTQLTIDLSALNNLRERDLDLLNLIYRIAIRNNSSIRITEIQQPVFEMLGLLKKMAVFHVPHISRLSA